MPGLKHRFCVRHLYANLKGKGYSGKQFKDALWGASRAANENQFKNYLSVIRGIVEKHLNTLSKETQRCSQCMHLE
jgi:hypothetical protein